MSPKEVWQWNRLMSPYYMEYSITMNSSGFKVLENWTYDYYTRNPLKKGNLKRNTPRYFNDIPYRFETRLVHHIAYDLCWN